MYLVCYFNIVSYLKIRYEYTPIPLAHWPAQERLGSFVQLVTSSRITFSHLVGPNAMTIHQDLDTDEGMTLSIDIEKHRDKSDTLKLNLDEDEAFEINMTDKCLPYDDGLSTPMSEMMHTPRSEVDKSSPLKKEKLRRQLPSYNEADEATGEATEEEAFEVEVKAVDPEIHRGDSLIKAANEAIEKEELAFEPAGLPDTPNLRDTLRLMHAHGKRDFPSQCALTTSGLFLKSRKPPKKEIQLTMHRDALVWRRVKNPDREKGRLDTNDIVGAATLEPDAFRIHYFTRHKRKIRKHRTLDLFTSGPEVTSQWVDAIQELVRWQARVDASRRRRKIKVVVNPHSGKRKGPAIYRDDVRPFLELAGFDIDMEETQFSRHAMAMGKRFSTSLGYEALVFVSGDGTLCEYMNGLLARPEAEWQDVVSSTPISLISAGTQNAFGTGVGIPTTHAAVFAIIKRKFRPMDVITACAEHEPTQIHYSCCGLGWGVAADIAAESERYRNLGTFRYAFLKLKRGFLNPRGHSGKVSYVATNPPPELRRYRDVRNKPEDVVDQHDVESPPPVANFRKSTTWKSVRDPAGLSRYHDSEQWTTESGEFFGIGVLNTAPDAKYSHPSDGNIDLLIARKGNLFQQLQLLVYYLFDQNLKSPLMSYVKAKAVIIEQNETQYGLNIDGEVLPGPGPFRMEVVPSLFKVLTEK